MWLALNLSPHLSRNTKFLFDCVYSTRDFHILLILIILTTWFCVFKIALLKLQRNGRRRNCHISRTKLSDFFVKCDGKKRKARRRGWMQRGSSSFSNDRKSEKLPRQCLSSGHLRTRPLDFFPPACAVFWVHCLDSVCLGSDSFFREIVPREPERTRSDCVIIDSGNDETVAINFHSRRRLRLTKETRQPHPISTTPLRLSAISSHPIDSTCEF